MDLKIALTQKPHDTAWVKAYLEFIQGPHTTGPLVNHHHHILPRSVFPEFSSFEDHPRNRAALTPHDHLIAHYYLFKALPGEPSIALAFKMMVGFRFQELKRSGFSETLVREIADAYETAMGLGKPWSEKARQKRSDAMKGSRPEMSFTGREHTGGTKIKMSASQQQRAVEDPESFSRNKPRGENHPFYGTTRPESTRSKISTSLTGKTAPDLTKSRMSATHNQRLFDAIPEPEHVIYRHALTLTTEEACILHRRAFKTNSRPYNILTGLMIIRLGKCDATDPRYYQQAFNWLNLSGYVTDPLQPRDPNVRLGTGYQLAPGQASTHDLRKVGLAKGVTRAKQNFDEIPQEEHEAFTRAWEAGTDDALVTERKRWKVRGRAYNILSGMLDLRAGLGTPERFERWRQAALWLHLSHHPLPSTLPTPSLSLISRFTGIIP